MQALRLHPDRSLRLGEEPIPEPGPGEALVRVLAVGLCGSDRHWALEGGIGETRLVAPVVPGHEFAGVVESGRLKGRLVAVDPAIPCGDCEPCRTGADNLCLAIRFAGHGDTDGALREWVAWPERSLHPVADRLDPAEAALVEPLAIIVHGIDLAAPIHGATIGVVGCGPIGLLFIALARTLAAGPIFATDALAHRVAAATATGARAAFVATPDGEERAQILDATGGRGVDIAIDASGEPDAIDTAVEIARPGGQVILAGIPTVDRTAFTASTARRKGLMFKLVRRSPSDAFRRAAELASDQALDLCSLVTKRYPLADSRAAFDALIERSGVKVIIEPGMRSGTLPQ